MIAIRSESAEDWLKNKNEESRIMALGIDKLFEQIQSMQQDQAIQKERKELI